MQPLVTACCALMPLLLLCVFAVVHRRRRTRFVSLVDAIPGPPCSPVVGNLLQILVPRNRQAAVRDGWVSKYGPIYRTWLGSVAQVNITRPEHAEVILSSTKCMEKSYVYKLMRSWLGEGLLTSSGDKWRLRRKLITPTFHFKVLDSFVEVFVEKSQRLLRRLDRFSGGEAFDIHPYISSCALDIVCETAMGTPVNAQQAAGNPYVAAVYEMTELVMERSRRPWLFFSPVFRRSSLGQRTAKCLAVLHGFTAEVIRERKALRAKESEGKSSGQLEENAVGEKKRPAFLDLLLDACDKEKLLTDTEIREEVDTFMFEGHDTTTAAVSWALLLLGSHMDVQERVCSELDAQFGDSDRPPTTRDLQALKYLEQVLKEALRLYPSVPFVGRCLAEDTRIGDYLVPAGCMVNIHIFHIHRCADQFPHPERFDPDNFLPERARTRQPYAYIPFSAGPRNCIGQKFAMLEEKVILAAILRRYRVHSPQRPEQLTLLSEMILRSEHGIQLQIVPRPKAGRQLNNGDCVEVQP
ncbi:cytochrome P450 4C1-like [Bacillus rossius redtenbacheri]|uniref:cytochrome P450 4C1-like n=1 Tax=Bacillus rossius redtenbacheri TaxID=93214 RepID=UPI002FDEDACC